MKKTEPSIEDGPSIDVVQTLTMRLRDMKKILEAIETYVKDVQLVSVGMKGQSLVANNMHAYVSAQSALDVALDIQSLIRGEAITTIKEIREEIEKEKEKEKKKEDLSYVQ